MATVSVQRCDVCGGGRSVNRWSILLSYWDSEAAKQVEAKSGEIDLCEKDAARLLRFVERGMRGKEAKP